MKLGLKVLMGPVFAAALGAASVAHADAIPYPTPAFENTTDLYLHRHGGRADHRLFHGFGRRL